MAETDPVEEVIIGDDYDLDLVAVERDGVTRTDLTDQEVSILLRRFPDQTPILAKNSEDDPEFVEITNPPRGEFKIILPSASSSLLTPGRWTYVIKRSDGSQTKTIGQNELWVHRDQDNWSWRDVQSYMMDTLGAGVITVELTRSQVFQCVLAAVAEYSRLLPLTLYNTISVPRRGRVNLTQAGYGRGLIDVRVDRPTGFPSGFGFSYPISALTAGYAGGSVTGIGSLRIGELEELFGFYEMASRVLSAEFEWEWDAPWLYVANVPSSVRKVFYAVSDDHIVQTVPSPDRLWINKYATARAKGILGSIRGKYQSVNTPGGGTSLDGNELRQESATELEQLLDELRTKIPDRPFIWG
jgi:hypothetical protein